MNNRSFKEIDISTEFDILKNNRIIIYGAGARGGRLLDTLTENNIDVEAFYDDDITRGGTIYRGKTIMTQRDLESLDKARIVILISSMYVEKIARKANSLGFNRVYADIDDIMRQDDEEYHFADYTNNMEFIERLNAAKNLFTDKNSRLYFDTVMLSVKEGHASKKICDLYTDESQYFINAFDRELDGFVFLDAGAYTGDTVREMLSKGIKPGYIYCFEADPLNYDRLIKYVNGLKEIPIRAENMALWDKETSLDIKKANYNATVEPATEDGNVIGFTIDEYFKNIKIDFIKMDIEGAERHALQGGMRTILRDRPVLAISIYHSLEDIADIPLMLGKNLDNYNYIIKHHSFSYSETVMYCVPNDRKIKL